jgi:heat-inducible transcriptional repressor
MACLEEGGFIRQPHTSAGRIPTDEGYRYYIGHLMKREELSPQECESIQRRISNARGKVHLILEEASRIIGKISNELSVVITPWMSFCIFDRLEIIGLSEKKILIVIHVRSRSVKTVVLETESDLDQNDLKITADVLNERLSGLTLFEIQNTIGYRIKNAERGNHLLIRRFTELAEEIFNFSEPLEVHTSGTQNIIRHPEFSDTDMLKRLLTLIDNRQELVQLFSKRTKDIEITIGRENQDTRLQSFSLIAAGYERGKDVGALGVIGPIRMRYSKILPLINTVARTMTQYLS